MVKIYEVGGAVRDKILGLKPKDIDYAVEASSYEEMRNWVIANTKKIFLETPQYLTIRALTNDNKAVDYVLCRKESGYSDRRHPDNVVVGTILDDLSRRDFTVNAIAIDEDGYYFDPFNGRKDAEQKFLRCVGNAQDRFEEDPLRIIRAIRFAITKDFFISMDIWEVLMWHQHWIPKMNSVSKERIYDELYKCFEYNTVKTLSFLNTIPEDWTEFLFSNGLWLEPTFKER